MRRRLTSVPEVQLVLGAIAFAVIVGVPTLALRALVSVWDPPEWFRVIWFVGVLALVVRLVAWLLDGGPQALNHKPPAPSRFAAPTVPEYLGERPHRIVVEVNIDVRHTPQARAWHPVTGEIIDAPEVRLIGPGGDAT